MMIVAGARALATNQRRSGLCQRKEWCVRGDPNGPLEAWLMKPQPR